MSEMTECPICGQTLLHREQQDLGGAFGGRPFIDADRYVCRNGCQETVEFTDAKNRSEQEDGR